MSAAHDIDLLRDLFDAAVAAADPMRCVPPHLAGADGGRLIVVGAGKASARMAEAVEAVMGPQSGLVITRTGYGRPLNGIEMAEASHPVPDAAGVAATRRLIDLCRGAGPNDRVLALISGGGSALLVAPAPGLTLADKQGLTRALLDSGAPIDAINTVRKHLSAVKGGQLALAAAPAQVLALMISDVPGDDLAAIASGPTVAEATRPADARAILERYGIAVPPPVAALLSGPSRVAPPGALGHVENRIIASPAMALEAAAEAARKLGMRVEILGDAIEGIARDLAAEHAGLARRIAADLVPGAPPVLLLSGGECTVERRGTGQGGPNAEYALALAISLDAAPGILAIACDTDGVDGSAEVAGAVIGPATIARARAAGIDPQTALDDNDAHGFFGALGDQVVTGPTLTNVNDFRAILIKPPM
jgi:glycerate 2-kinase